MVGKNCGILRDDPGERERERGKEGGREWERGRERRGGGERVGRS